MGGKGSLDFYKQTFDRREFGVRPHDTAQDTVDYLPEHADSNDDTLLPNTDETIVTPEYETIRVRRS